MTDHLPRTCEICHQPLPTSGVGQRRKVCLRLECARERKRREQQQWRANNPEYFKGRYATYVKPWLAAHPGYLKRRRQTRRQLGSSPQTTLALPDIQVEISPCSHAARAPGRDIQVKITCTIHMAKRVWRVASDDIQISQAPHATYT